MLFLAELSMFLPCWLDVICGRRDRRHIAFHCPKAQHQFIAVIMQSVHKQHGDDAFCLVVPMLFPLVDNLLSFLSVFFL